MAWHKITARLSQAAFCLMKSLCEVADGITSGFWLGIMSRKSLEYSDELFYNKTKYYREAKYNQSGLFDWEKPLIEKHYSGAGTILLIAAGGGRETLALSKMGIEVDSYECNPNLLEFGNGLLQQNGFGIRIRHLPRNSVPDVEKKYDGIIIGWGAYSLMPGRENRIDFVKRLSSFLKKEAPMMISFINTQKRSRIEKISYWVSGFLRLLSSDKRELGDRLVPDFIHYFMEDEIKSEMAGAGQKIIDYYSKECGCVVTIAGPDSTAVVPDGKAGMLNIS